MEDRSELIQEEYVNTSYGPWKVLVICQSLNRTTWKQAEKAIREIFLNWPSPRDLALIPVHEIPDLIKVLKPLGLSNNRRCALMAMSLQYYTASQELGSEYDKYRVKDFKGCGQYAEDAWTLFVLKRECAPEDRRLRDYAKRVGLYKGVMV